MCLESHFSRLCEVAFLACPMLSGLDLYVISSVMLQMFSIEFRSGEFAGQSSLSIKFGKFL